MLNSGHTLEWSGPTIEFTRRNGKRVFARAFKSWLVERATQPGVSVAGLALSHGINANQLRRWMKLAAARTEGAVQLLPVRIEAARPTPAYTPPSDEQPGVIEVEIHGARVRLHGAVRAEQLRTVLAALAARA